MFNPRSSFSSTDIVLSLSKFLFLFVVSVIFTACGGNLDAEMQAKYDEVMEMHDISMENHHTMMMLGKKIRKTKKPENISPETGANIEQTLQGIDRADEDMMSWMHDLKRPRHMKSMATNEIREYLDNELEDIKKIDEDIKAQTAKAKAILEPTE